MELEDKLYSSTEVAKILGVSRRTLYRYLDSGTLPSMQLPSGRHRFTKEQVEAFLKTSGGVSDESTTQTVNVQVTTAPKEKIQEKPSVFTRVGVIDEE